MSRFLALLQREYWENRGALLITPIVIGVVTLVGMIAMFTAQWRYDTDDAFMREIARALAEHDGAILERFFLFLMVGPASSLFQTVLGVVVIFYLLGCLYDDRKDRSILFWKSLPASDSLTIGSKLFTAMVTAPVLYLGILIVTHVVAIGLLSLMLMSVGFAPGETLFTHLSPLHAWSLLAASWFSMSVWALPVYGWLMLASAFAPRLPLLFAVLPPLILSFLQAWIDFLQHFTLRYDNVLGAIGQWFVNAPIIAGIQIDDNESMEDMAQLSLGIPQLSDGRFGHEMTFANLLDRLLSTDMLIGLALAIVFIGAALWLRRRATDN